MFCAHCRPYVVAMNGRRKLFQAPMNTKLSACVGMMSAAILDTLNGFSSRNPAFSNNRRTGRS